MNWITLNKEIQLQEIIERSDVKAQVIFKHSTRCSISSMAKNRLERNYFPVDIDFYFLDLLAHRPLAQMITEIFKIPHESPQVLLIKNGVCVYNESHSGITMEDITERSDAA